MRARWLLKALATVATVFACRGSDTKAILWQAPEAITLRDWIWGPGGQERAPQPPYRFVEEDFKGTNAKIKVRDAKGDHWTVKFGGENHGDVFVSRLLYASGYITVPTYYAESGVVTGAHDLKRAKPHLGKDGSFTRARFKLSDHKMLKHVESEAWSWNDNPFVGTRELNGLKILIMLTSNWDAKDARDGEGSNTAVYSRPGSEHQLYYAFNDWGATMGKWGGFFGRDKWNPAGYRDQTKSFARGGPGGTIEWGYRGKHGDEITSGISANDVRWLMTYLSPVTDEQLRAGLRAAGASETDIGIYARSIRERIAQLERVAALPAAQTTTATLPPRNSRP